MIKIILIFFYTGVACSVALSFEDFTHEKFLSELIAFTKDGELPIKVSDLEDKHYAVCENKVLDFIGLIEKHEGYTAEEYQVHTSDKYILKLHRITGSPSHPKRRGKKVVYMQHGFMASSDFMVLTEPKKTLAFLLADAGYDVWLGNVRGNTYSRAHETLSPDKDADRFWNFNLDDMAAKDIPALINHVLSETLQSKLTYIGYSMGTTLMFMLLSSTRAFDNKIDIFINLAPVAYFEHAPLKLEALMTLAKAAVKIHALKNEVLSQSKPMYEFAKLFCSNGKPNICSLFNKDSMDVTRMDLHLIPDIFAHSPAGTSAKALQHYAQIINSGKLAKFNNGPEYDVSRIPVPIAAFYGKNDLYVSVQDAKDLQAKLQNVKVFEAVDDPVWNHLDFVFNNDAAKLVYRPVLSVIHNYT